MRDDSVKTDTAFHTAMLTLEAAIQEGDTDAADRLVIEMVEKFPRCYEARIIASAYYLKRNQNEKFLLETTVAIALDPTNPVAYRRLAKYLASQENNLSELILELGMENSGSHPSQKRWSS